jgi:MFS family permease
MAPSGGELVEAPSMSPAPASAAVRASRSYMLTMLTLIYIVNMVDRRFMPILQEPIKREFGLRDWQVGMVSGLAFAACYAVAGIPIARLADRRSFKRVDIVTIALVMWSAATAFGGLAANFIQLITARFMVGIGEAGSGPPSQSIISDLYRPHERGRAMGVFALASPLGGAVGLVIGGYIAQTLNWRAALMLVGLPGVLLALIFRSTVSEPRWGDAAARDKDKFASVSFVTVAKTIARKRSFLWLIAGGCFGSFTTLGLQSWLPSYFIRSFGLSVGEVGLVWGLASGVAGFVGILGGGFLADKFGVRHPRAILIIPAIGMVMAAPCQMLAVMVHQWHTALLLLLIPTALSAVWTAPSMKLNQGIAPLAMRATVVAINTFLVNMIGLGLGPVVLGAVSDLFAASAGNTEIGLRYALIAMSPIYLLSGLCFFIGSRFVEKDLEPPSDRHSYGKEDA